MNLTVVEPDALAIAAIVGLLAVSIFGGALFAKGRQRDLAFTIAVQFVLLAGFFLYVSFNAPLESMF